MNGELESNDNTNHDHDSGQRPVTPGEQQIVATRSSPEKNDTSRGEEPCTPEKVQKIPKDESFKTCKATMPTPATRRQLRATPARNSILSGGKPYKEVSTSGRKFNSRRKGASKRNGTNDSRLNESADSNQTFVRHERDLLYDPDSLDLDVSRHDRRQPLDFDNDIPRPDISRLSLSPKKLSPVKMSPIKKLNQQAQEKTEPPLQEKQTTRRISRQLQKPMPTSTPMPFAVPKAKPKPKPNAFYFNRYMSSTAKKPQQPKQQLPQQESMFKKPSSVISNFSVASSRRCLSQWNTPRLTRAQSFKSTAELEREYFSSLRSRF